MIGHFDSVDATPEVNPVQQETQKKDAPSLDSLWGAFKELFPIKKPDSESDKSDAEIDAEKTTVQLPSVLDDGTIVDIPETSGIDDDGKPYTDNSGIPFPNHTFEKNGSQYETDSNGRIVKIDGVYLGDDNGTPYLDDNGGYLPNCTFTLDGITYKTDDNGNVYMADGKLLPNTTYELNGNKYTTDGKGRIISCEATPHRTPENPRDNDAQKRAGGEDRHDNDQGGHIVSRDLGGDSGDGNLVAMDFRINQSDYKRMENAIKDALDKGKDVTTKTEFIYSGDSNRPDKIKLTVTIDGRDTVYVFDNNLDGSLIDEVPEDGKEAVQDELDETGGVVSSIKKEYDENGNLISTTVTITYTGEDGANHRTEVVIDHTQGGANQ